MRKLLITVSLIAGIAGAVTAYVLNCCEYKAYIKSVYDGDTVTADIHVGLGIYKEEKCRLLGIDTPELRGEEREAGLVSRDSLRSWILNKQVIIQTDNDKTGKYGRLLVTIFKDSVNINQKLIDDGLAEVY